MVAIGLAMPFPAMVGAVPWYGDIVQGPIKMIDGAWQLPQAPGLGIEVNEEALTAKSFKFWEAPHLTRRDGSVTNW